MDIIYKMLGDLHPECDFCASDDFVVNGYLDSFDIVTIVSELEEAFDISIDGLDIVPENFSSVNAIAEMVRKNGGKI